VYYKTKNSLNHSMSNRTCDLKFQTLPNHFDREHFVSLYIIVYHCISLYIIVPFHHINLPSISLYSHHKMHCSRWEIPIPPGTQEDQGQSDAARWCGDAGVDALRAAREDSAIFPLIEIQNLKPWFFIEMGSLYPYWNMESIMQGHLQHFRQKSLDNSQSSGSQS